MSGRTITEDCCLLFLPQAENTEKKSLQNLACASRWAHPRVTAFWGFLLHLLQVSGKHLSSTRVLLVSELGKQLPWFHNNFSFPLLILVMGWLRMLIAKLSATNGYFRKSFNFDSFGSFLCQDFDIYLGE